jgi:hypothetical protein
MTKKINKITCEGENIPEGWENLAFHHVRKLDFKGIIRLYRLWDSKKTPSLGWEHFPKCGSTFSPENTKNMEEMHKLSKETCEVTGGYGTLHGRNGDRMILSREAGILLDYLPI